MGLNVMIAGLVFQVAALTLFIALASEFAICLRRQHLKGEYQVSHSASLRKDDYAAIRRKKTWTLFLFLTPPALCLTNEANNGSPCSCDYHGLYSVHFLSGGAERRLWQWPGQQRDSIYDFGRSDGFDHLPLLDNYASRDILGESEQAQGCPERRRCHAINEVKRNIGTAGLTTRRSEDCYSIFHFSWNML